MKKILFLLIALSFIIISCKKEIIIKTGSIKGVVYNEFQQPIEGAKIEIETSTFTTSSNGIYSFGNLQAKEYTISVSKQCFSTKTQQVNIIPDETTIMDFNLIAGEVYISISDSILNVNYVTGSHNLSVSSNAAWFIENSSSWIECGISGGEGNKSFVVNYSKNEEDSFRIDTLTFISGSIKRKLIIHQSAPIKLISYEGRLGNQEKNIKDSIYLLFNKPITVENIKSTWDFCSSEVSFNQPVNSSAVLFSYPCAELGGKYPFSISVKDNEGNSFSKEIEVPFYKSKLDIEGNITDFLLVNDDKEMLISTYNPSKIIRCSIESGLVIRTYDLSTSISPLKLSYNPYNSKVYIMGSDPAVTNIDNYIERPDVFTLNIKTGEVSKAFTVQPDIYDAPQTPSIFPRDLGVTKLGIGIILLVDEHASGLRWKLIDCTRNDSIYNYTGDDGGIITTSPLFMNVHRNFDDSKLYLTEAYHGAYYWIFDGVSLKLSIIRPSLEPGHSITPYRKADKFFARKLYEQFIIDPNGNQSQITELDSRHEGHADFSYRENEENIIFLCEAQRFSVPPIPSRFYVLNYNEGSILKSSDVLTGLTNFSVTIDGKYAVAYRQNLGNSYSIYVFKTEDLY